MEYLDQHGFLTTPVPVWSPRYRAELQAQYDEAWLYGNIRALKQGATLPEDVEREALSLALTSWPISLALARYYTHQDRQRAESLARQFADLAAAETDADRLARHRWRSRTWPPSLSGGAALKPPQSSVMLRQTASSWPSCPRSSCHSLYSGSGIPPGLRGWS